MLKNLTRDQVLFIALLAETARQERDSFLGNVAERSFGGTEPARGEHNPTAELGYEPLPRKDEQLGHLSAAIDALEPSARLELFALMRIGQGDFAAAKWHRALSDGELLGNAALIAALMEDIDLHDHLQKGLFEAEAL